MISTLYELASLTPVFGLSRWLRTDLIIAATLLFLLFASWATLLAAPTSLREQHSRREPDADSPTRQPAKSPSKMTERARTNFGIFGIVLGLLSSLALFVICAW